jgi:hypothetical protein
LANASTTKVLTATLKHVETFGDMSTDAIHFILCLEREMFVDHVRLRYFIMLCNNVEYKNVGRDESLGQLYDGQIEIKIFYKQPGWAYSFSMTNRKLTLRKILQIFVRGGVKQHMRSP